MQFLFSALPGIFPSQCQLHAEIPPSHLAPTAHHLCKNFCFPMVSRVTHSQSQYPSYQALHVCNFLFNVSVTQFPNLSHCCLPHPAPSCSVNVPSALLPQDLCTCYSCCLQSSFFKYPNRQFIHYHRLVLKYHLIILIPFLLLFLPSQRS